MNKDVDRKYIIDFDSTFVKVEALDELSKIALRSAAWREAIVSEIESITALGMEGKISFNESLKRRLSLFAPTKEHISLLVSFLLANITPSVVRNREWFFNNSEKIYIISGGFREYIVPVVSEFGIPEEQVMANSFIFDNNGKVIGFDDSNLLSQALGKVKQLECLQLTGEIIMIGDGYTDYQVREYGKAHSFFAFTENICRESVVSKADRLLSSFDDLVSN